MKKILPLFLFAALQCGAQSLVLTKAAFEPVIGDSSKHYMLDTSYYVNGLNVGLTGANTVWTYSNLVTNTTQVLSAILSPSAVPSSSAYSGCSYVQQQGTMNTFYKSVSSPSTQTEFMGVSSTSLSMNFSNTAVSMRYPMSFGNTVTDNYSGTFSFSLSGSAAGNSTVTADGTGTLVLPGGVTFTNVLRVKSIQATAFSAIIISGNLRQTTYSWYDASSKFPIFSISYQSLSISTSPNPTITAMVTGNKNNFTIGMKENELKESNTFIYPTPTSDVLSFHSSLSFETHEWKIYSLTGQLMITSGAESVSVANLPAGIYLAELQTNKGSVRRKIVKD